MKYQVTSRTGGEKMMIEASRVEVSGEFVLFRDDTGLEVAIFPAGAILAILRSDLAEKLANEEPARVGFA